jgi:hypothetical protein
MPLTILRQSGREISDEVLTAEFRREFADCVSNSLQIMNGECPTTSHTGHGAQHIRAGPPSLSSRRIVKNLQLVKLGTPRDTLDEIALGRMHRFRWNKFVADSVNGSNKSGTVRIVLDFLSQSHDAIVDSAATGAFPLRPQGAD